MSESPLDPKQLAEMLEKGDRRALAQAITLVESSRAEDWRASEELLAAVLPTESSATRIGVTGIPGVGKSSFIEALGCKLVAQGHRVAVLAIDPSSSLSGGSILGDKTRMEELARHGSAFIRPSPSSGSLGGVGRRSREAILLCEAAGYDLILVETVGVGQSEASIADMVDCLLLLMLPGTGDELQGIKRGLLELADLLLMHKADGDRLEAARLAGEQLQSALNILGRGDGQRSVISCSSHTGDGLDACWSEICRQIEAGEHSGSKADRRRKQDLRWFEQSVGELIQERLLASTEVVQQFSDFREAVRLGKLHATQAARRLAETATQRLPS
ncbi:MAG: methylmalonyl Co-A mutase-associated GTPase MeaB [Planctomycetota bacterium]|jgi:LAO/AO transport system kinase